MSSPGRAPAHAKGSSPSPTSRPQPPQTKYVAGAVALIAVGESGTPSGQRAGLRVELVDHLVPHRHQLAQAAPECLVAARLEVVQRHALLLHPGEVTEVEDAVALVAAQLAQVIGG